MAQYKGEFECGHEGYVNIIGPSRERKWKLERAFDRKCDDCRTKEYFENLEKEKAQAKQKAIEMELPELSGTDKQVSWANTIRQKYIDYMTNKVVYIDEECESYDFCDKESKAFTYLRRKEIDSSEIIDFMINNLLQAKDYIDNREIGSMKKKIFQAIKNNKPENKIEKEMEKQINEELTAYPEGSEELEPVTLEVNENKITAKYSKCDKFKEIIKSLDFTWNWSNYKWELCITNKNGSKEDRAIETGNKLLNAGFPVKFDTLELKEKAIKADYKPEVTRWIVLMKYGQLGIWFKYRDDKLYKTARTIKSSRWNNPYITVKIEHFAEVLDYAELYGFEIKENAEKAINEYKEKIENIEKVTPEKNKTTRNKKDGLEEILDSDDSILDDLKDD